MDPKILAFYHHYHQRSRQRPTLYISGPRMITVVLPQDLLEYANAAAGHSGFGAGARAVGIRRQVSDARRAIADVFATPESLARFLESSECDAREYVESVRARHLSRPVKIGQRAQTDDRPAERCFDELYARYDVPALVARYGRDVVAQARRYLTVNEFQLRFGLES